MKPLVGVLIVTNAMFVCAQSKSAQEGKGLKESQEKPRVIPDDGRSPTPQIPKTDEKPGTFDADDARRKSGNAKDALQSLFTAASELEGRVNKDDIRQIKDSVEYFRKLPDIPRAYRDALKEEAALAERLQQKKNLNDAEKQQLGAIANDLRVKRAHAEKNNGALSTVKANVKTINASNAEEKPYTVSYVPAYYENDRNQYKSFRNASSPTSEDLTAGYWVMWSVAPSGAPEGERKRVELGSSGQPDENVDLFIPGAKRPSP